MAASTGYSGTPLAKKLGVTDETTIHTIGAPENYRALLAPLPEGARVSPRVTGNPRFVHVFTKSRAELERRLEQLRDVLAQDGVLWISWPKKSAKIDTDITEDTIRALALPRGFVDVKVCAVDATWSGLKLVIRRELRTSR